MEALARIRVLVQVRAVEVGEAVLVVREVRRHPVEDHADARLVQLVDEPHEVLGVAVAPGRREVAGRLVAPRAVERVLHDRQQLDVGEAETGDVLDELRREVAVAEHLARIVGRAPPRAEVHLVHRHRRVERVARRPRRHPLVVAPLVVELPDDGRGQRRLLGAERQRIGLLDAVAAVVRDDRVLVARAVARAGHEALPDAGARDGERGALDESQPFQSPITETDSAFGAHTEKVVPATPETVPGCEPSTEARLPCVPSEK